MNIFNSKRKNTYVPPSLNNNVKTQGVPLKEEDFPALGGLEKKDDKKDKNVITYSSVANENNDYETEGNDLKEGWIEISKEFPYVKNKKCLDTEPPNPDVIFNKLAENYEKWKEEFIAVHGKEFYDYHYSMPPSHVPIPDYDEDILSENEDDDIDEGCDEEEYTD